MKTRDILFALMILAILVCLILSVTRCDGGSGQNPPNPPPVIAGVDDVSLAIIIWGLIVIAFTMIAGLKNIRRRNKEIADNDELKCGRKL